MHRHVHFPALAHDCSADRLIFDGNHGLSSASTTFQGTMELACSAEGSVTMAATGGRPNSPFAQATATMTIDASCAAAACECIGARARSLLTHGAQPQQGGPTGAAAALPPPLQAHSSQTLPRLRRA